MPARPHRRSPILHTCFIVVITSDKNRTARLAVTDAFPGIGYLTGISLGTRLKNSFGYNNTLFTEGLVLCVIGLLYAVILLNDSYHLVSEEKTTIFDMQR